MGRLFCAEASVCGYTRFGGEVEGIISRSFRVDALLAAECLISAVDDVLGECRRMNVLCMLCYCHLKFSGHVEVVHMAGFGLEKRYCYFLWRLLNLYLL